VEARRSLWEGVKTLLEDEWKWWMQAARAQVHLDASLCIGCWTCYQVCPVGCFRQNLEGSVIRLVRPEGCVACGACSLQWPTQAVTLE